MMQDQCQRFGVYQTHLPHSSIYAMACQTPSFKMLSNPSIPESFAGFYSHCAIIFITSKWCIFKRPPSSNLFTLFSPLNCSTLLTHTYLSCQMTSTLFSSGFQALNYVPDTLTWSTSTQPTWSTTPIFCPRDLPTSSLTRASDCCLSASIMFTRLPNAST